MKQIDYVLNYVEREKEFFERLLTIYSDNEIIKFIIDDLVIIKNEIKELKYEK